MTTIDRFQCALYIVQIELTPSSLITIIKKDRNLTCLLILVAGSIAPELQTIMADVTKYKIYWLNR